MKRKQKDAFCRQEKYSRQNLFCTADLRDVLLEAGEMAQSCLLFHRTRVLFSVSTEQLTTVCDFSLRESDILFQPRKMLPAYDTLTCMQTKHSYT